jgi:hypothetical protein
MRHKEVGEFGKARCIHKLESVWDVSNQIYVTPGATIAELFFFFFFWRNQVSGWAHLVLMPGFVWNCLNVFNFPLHTTFIPCRRCGRIGEGSRPTR